MRLVEELSGIDIKWMVHVGRRVTQIKTDSEKNNLKKKYYKLDGKVFHKMRVVVRL